MLSLTEGTILCNDTPKSFWLTDIGIIEKDFKLVLIMSAIKPLFLGRVTWRMPANQVNRYLHKTAAHSCCWGTSNSSQNDNRKVLNQSKQTKYLTRQTKTGFLMKLQCCKDLSSCEKLYMEISTGLVFPCDAFLHTWVLVNKGDNRMWRRSKDLQPEKYCQTNWVFMQWIKSGSVKPPRNQLPYMHIKASLSQRSRADHQFIASLSQLWCQCGNRQWNGTQMATTKFSLILSMNKFLSPSQTLFSSAIARQVWWLADGDRFRSNSPQLVDRVYVKLT